MKIKMLKTENGSEDGRFTKTYEQGKEYEVLERLAEVFISIGVAEKVDSPKVEKPLKGKK